MQSMQFVFIESPCVSACVCVFVYVQMIFAMGRLPFNIWLNEV